MNVKQESIMICENDDFQKKLEYQDKAFTNTVLMVDQSVSILYKIVKRFIFNFYYFKIMFI